MKKLTGKRKEEFWKEHIERFKQSGESRKQYCIRHKISYWSFRDWHKKIEAGEGTKLVKISQKYHKREESPSCIDIVISQNIVIRVSSGFNGEDLRNVINELGALS
jgi:hypothetical protein